MQNRKKRACGGALRCCSLWMWLLLKRLLLRLLLLLLHKNSRQKSPQSSLTHSHTNTNTHTHTFAVAPNAPLTSPERPRHKTASSSSSSSSAATLVDTRSGWPAQTLFPLAGNKRIMLHMHGEYIYVWQFGLGLVFGGRGRGGFCVIHRSYIHPKVTFIPTITFIQNNNLQLYCA